MADPTILRQQQERFDAMVDHLLVDHEGKWVLFRHGSPVQFFDRHEEAYAAGLNKFGPDETFLVVRVERSSPQPVSVEWDAGVMFG